MGNTGSRKGSMVAVDGGMRQENVKAGLINLSKTRKQQKFLQGERQRKHHARDERHTWDELMHNVNAVWSERVVFVIDRALDDVMAIGGCAEESRKPDDAKAREVSDHTAAPETKKARDTHSHRVCKFTDGRRDHRIGSASSACKGVGQRAPVVDNEVLPAAEKDKTVAAAVHTVRHVKSTVKDMIAEIKEREEKTRLHERTEHKTMTMARRRTNALKGLHINVRFPSCNDGQQDGASNNVSSPSA